MKKEKLTALYERLTKLKELDEEGNVYGGSASIEADWYVLDDFLEQLPDMYEELPDWYTAYYQVYMWEYQAFYEGLTGYYANFYESTDYDSIQKTAGYLSENGYGELAKCYNYALFNPDEFPKSEKWPPEWPGEIDSKILYAEEWISNHQIEIRDFFFDILFTHQDELMQICDLQPAVLKTN